MLQGEIVRVYHKRVLGPHLCFIDAIVISDETTLPHVIELCADGEEKSDAGLLDVSLSTAYDSIASYSSSTSAMPIITASDVHVGDVLIVEGDIDKETPRYPRAYILNIRRFYLLESWMSTFKAQKVPYAFHPPVFWSDGKIKNKQKEDDIENTELHKVDPFALAPAIILQCHKPLAGRIASYFRGRVASTCTKERLVYVYDTEETRKSSRFANTMLEERSKIIQLTSSGTSSSIKVIMDAIPAYFHSIIHRIYFVTEKVKVSLAETVLDFSNIPPERHPKQMKQLCFPREVESLLFETLLNSWEKSQLLISSSIEADIKQVENESSAKTDVCDSIVYGDGLYYTGINVPRIIVPKKGRTAVPSGAYWKLFEIRDRYSPESNDMDFNVSSSERKKTVSILDQRYRGRDLAIDIGASPGGWSYCLAQEFHTKLTIAVDPAAHMHDLVKEYYKLTDDNACGGTPSIRHWKMKGQEAAENLLLEAASSPPSAERRISIFVCDINDEMEKSVSLLEQLRDVLASPCLVVLTFKNTCRSKRAFEERKRNQMKKLERNIGVSNLQEIHLFANTKLETTVVGEIFS